MKLLSLGLVVVFCVVLVGLLSPITLANKEDTTEITGNVVSPPSVTTSVPWPVIWRLAILRGELTDMGTASSVKVYFEYGTDTTYGSTTRIRTIRHPRAFVAFIRGLSPDTTYHFRAVAVGDGISYGEDKSFTTRRHWWR